MDRYTYIHIYNNICIDIFIYIYIYIYITFDILRFIYALQGFDSSTILDIWMRHFFNIFEATQIYIIKISCYYWILVRLCPFKDVLLKKVTLFIKVIRFINKVSSWMKQKFWGFVLKKSPIITRTICSKTISQRITNFFK